MHRHKLLNVIMAASISSWLLFSLFQSSFHEALSWFGEDEQVHEVGSCPGNPSGETIIPTCGGVVYLVSAYRDEQSAPGTLRVIGVVRRAGRPKLYCHICNGSSVFSVSAKVLVHSDHFGFPYSTADLLCQMPLNAGQALQVSVSDRRLPDLLKPFILIHHVDWNANGPLPHQFTVCISTLFGNYSNVLQFVQSMEMYRLLGAGKVFVYKSDNGPLLQKVLDHYSSEGLLEIIPWEFGRHLKVSNSWTPSLGPGDLHYHGQIAALNDCIYRNRAASQYVVLVDIDEVIIPRIHNSWRAMMAFLSLHHLGVESFSFENAVFRSNVFGDGGRFDVWPGVPGVNILRHVDREPLRPYRFNARKLVVNPRAVVWTSVHSTLWQNGDSLEVPGYVARMHHYRTPDDTAIYNSQLVRDATLWKYSGPLIRKVSHTLRQVLGAQVNRP